MQCSRLFPVLVIMMAIVLLAGCTGTQDNAAPPATALLLAANLPPLSLTSSDVPANFSVIESGPRELGDRAALAKDLGWDGGYVTRLTTHPDPANDPTEIIQSVALYPPQNIPGIVTMAYTQDRSDPDMPWVDLNLTGLGTTSRGFYGKAKSALLVKPANANPLSSGPGNHDVQVVRQKDTAEIIFAKGNLLEVIRMTGPETDPAVLREIAGAAYRKIP